MQWSDYVHWRNKCNIWILKEMVELTVNDVNHKLLFSLHKRTELSWTFEPPCQIKVTAFSFQKKQILIWQFKQVALCTVDLSAEEFLPFFSLVSWRFVIFLAIQSFKSLLIQDGAGDALPVRMSGQSEELSKHTLVTSFSFVILKWVTPISN